MSRSPVPFVGASSPSGRGGVQEDTVHTASRFGEYPHSLNLNWEISLLPPFDLLPLATTANH